jgi:integrase/recombinase XerD
VCATRAEMVRVTGPLASFTPGFREYLGRLGYRSGYGLVGVMSELSAWMSGEGLDVGELTREAWETFVSKREFSVGGGQQRWRRAVSPLLEYLGEVAGLPAWGPPRVSCDPVEVLVDGYERYLRDERAMAGRSVRNYLLVARQSLSFAVSVVGELDLDALTAAVVIEFVTAEAQRLQVASAKATTTRLRSFLRFLYVRGLTASSLVGAVPSVAVWRLASLPQGLEAPQVAALLASCDRRSSIGRRDYAILVLLARLGLRAGEVARLQLGDIDWRAGDLVVRGKGSRVDRLPLPVDVGEALAGWLRRGRPRCIDRSVFVRMRAPQRGLSPEGISAVVWHACERAGLPPICAHRLRHTAATQMLRGGASLGEVGHVMRHRSSEVTSIYAKVDRRALSMVVRPWPTAGTDR